MRSDSIRQFDAATDALNFQYDYNEGETTLLKPLANRNAQVDLDLLRRIALWKLDRVLAVSTETIQKLRALATDGNLRVDSQETRRLLEELLACPGIGLPMASTILKFLRPDVFPIIDVRAYRALYGKKPYFSQSQEPKNIECYIQYAADIRNIALKLKRSLSEIDEQLYEFDKKHNGTM
jgi:thermostable 8-oxoguanine DNA glycosylase